MRTKILVVVIFFVSVVLVAVFSTAWIAYSLRSHAVSPDIANGIRQLVERFPHLQPLHTEAMETFLVINGFELIADVGDTERTMMIGLLLCWLLVAFIIPRLGIWDPM